jgi:hypothetical protein
MEAETKMATGKQLAYIESLGAEAGVAIDKPVAELTKVEASELIADLLRKANVGQNSKEAANGKSSMGIPGRKTDFGSGARLGMAFKCVYRNWVTAGVNIFEKKKEFIKNVLDTYKLINEIAEKALETAA